MDARFSFFKAGQGLFYGGRIRIENNVYTIVYDCGTSPFIAGHSKSLNREIDYFQQSNHHYPYTDKIDLLFISHLDYDHVSGLGRLLKEFKVEKIILPYIGQKQRQFFLVSLSNEISPDDLSLVDYTSFIENPHTYVRNNSKKTKVIYVRPGGDKLIDYQGSNDEGSSEGIILRGTKNTEEIEFDTDEYLSVYNNDLQLFIQMKWEFTIFVKDVNISSIERLHNCLKKTLNKKVADELTFDDIKEIVTKKREVAHNCYTKYIGEINSYGLVLLHGPINFEYVCGWIDSDCNLNHFNKSFHYHRMSFNYPNYRINNSVTLGTLLFGDTSLESGNNYISFPLAFIHKLANVHIVQVPHHGSSKNWAYVNFKKLKIGSSIDRWHNNVVSVCNFGYGNTYGHPSHKVLDDLSSSIFLNTQFSRLNIKYDVFY